MKKSTKVGIYLLAIVLGLIVSPAVAISEINAAKNSVKLTETTSISNNVKFIRIVGLDDLSYAPNFVHINKGETVTFLNVDGSNGGTDHTVTSVKLGTTEPDGKFDSGVLKVGESFQLNLVEEGIYQFFDSLHPTIPGRVIVS